MAQYIQQLYEEPNSFEEALLRLQTRDRLRIRGGKSITGALVSKVMWDSFIIETQSDGKFNGGDGSRYGISDGCYISGVYLQAYNKWYHKKEDLTFGALLWEVDEQDRVLIEGAKREVDNGEFRVYNKVISKRYRSYEDRYIQVAHEHGLRKDYFSLTDARVHGKPWSGQIVGVYTAGQWHYDPKKVDYKKRTMYLFEYHSIQML